MRQGGKLLLSSPRSNSSTPGSLRSQPRRRGNHRTEGGRVLSCGVVVGCEIPSVGLLSVSHYCEGEESTLTSPSHWLRR